MSEPRTLSQLLAEGTPLMPVEDCPTCRQIPAHCSRFEKGGELVGDDIPSAVGDLSDYIGSIPHWRGNISRCPRCHRLYWYDTEYEFLIGGSEDTVTWRRIEPEELFRDSWFVRHRLLPRVLDTQFSIFPHHVLVRVEGNPGWFALHDEGAETPIRTLDDLAALAARDLPFNLGDAEGARHYAHVADAVTGGAFRVVKTFDEIYWRYELTDEERQLKDDMRHASRVEREQAEKLADRVLVRRWITTDRKLICRVLSVFPNGEVRREDAVIGEALPIS